MTKVLINNLIHRFEPVSNTSFIYKCNKDGNIILNEDTIVPISDVYFIVSPLNPISFNCLSNVTKTCPELFIFEHLLKPVPANITEASEYKAKVLAHARKHNLLAKTVRNGYYIDNEPLLEWVPEPKDILRPLYDLPSEIKDLILVPINLRPGDEDIIILENDVVFLRHTSSLYNFIKIGDNLLTVRHYQIINKENKTPNLMFYAELDFQGKLLTMVHLGKSGNFKFGEHTIFGYGDLKTLQKKVFNFDAKTVVAFIQKSGQGFTAARHQSEQIGLMKQMGLRTFEDDDDDDFIKMSSMTDAQLEDYQDIYGNFF